MPKVSIVLPVYDCVKYLRAAIEGIAKQTFKDFELIIIDDHCTDGSEKIIDIYGQAEQIKVIRHDRNKGLAESLNDGLVAAKGELIAIQHSDDISLPFRIEKEVAYLEQSPSIYMVGTWMQYIDESGRILPKDGWWLRQVKYVPDDPAIIRKKLLEINCFVHTSIMFRNTGEFFYDQSMVPSEDYHMWLQMSEKHNVGLIREVLVHYRRHHKQISNTDNGQLMKTKAEEAVKRARQRRGI